MRNLNALILNLIGDEPTSLTTPGSSLLFAASQLVGISEDKNPDLVNAIRSTVTRPWGEAWCMDFVQTCVAYAEHMSGKQSSLPSTEGVLDLWNRALTENKVATPQIGDVILWRMGLTEMGHCGIITGIDSLCYATIEGNTSDSSFIDRMGRGVFAKRRARGGTKTFTEVGFIRCFP